MSFFHCRNINSIENLINENEKLIKLYNENKFNLLKKIYSNRPLNKNESLEKFITEKIITKVPIKFNDIFDFTLNKNLEIDIKNKFNKCISTNFRIFLLYGPKNCGKTLITQSLINENKNIFKFYMINNIDYMNNIQNFSSNLKLHGK